MSTLQDSYVSRVLFARPVSGWVPGSTAWRWRRLTTSLFDPYRPELQRPRSKMACEAWARRRVSKLGAAQAQL
jgi:hypothetical protein